MKNRQLIYSGVYCITHSSGLFYIGSSFNIAHRFEQHMISSIAKWIPKSCRDDYTLSLLEECPSTILKEKEQKYITELQPPLNINMTTKPPVRLGEKNNKAIGTDEQYAQAFIVLAEGKTAKQAAKLTGLTLNVTKSILSLKGHKYLHSKYPEEYNKLLLRKGKSGHCNKSFTLYHKDHGTVTFTGSYIDFYNKYGLPHNSKIGEVLKGRRPKVHGWGLPKLVEAK